MIDPVLISVGPLQLRWYALAYIAGILIGWWYAKRLAGAQQPWAGYNAGYQRQSTPLDVDDFIIWLTIGIVAGGRLGYVLFYDPVFFLQNPGQIPALWQGGMSFHGGFLGVLLAMILFARSRGMSILSFFDVIASGVPFGLFFGRLANFINAELWGTVTQVPWGFVFPGAGPLPRHPSQLYEAGLEGVVLFAAMALVTWRRGWLRWPGAVAGVFAGGYGLARFIVEFFRTPDAHIGYLAGGWLTMGMVLSLPMILLGLVLIWNGVRLSRTVQPAQ